MTHYEEYLKDGRPEFEVTNVGIARNPYNWIIHTSHKTAYWYHKERQIHGDYPATEDNRADEQLENVFIEKCIVWVKGNHKESDYEYNTFLGSFENWGK